MFYTLTTISKTTGDLCYFDGYGFSLLPENAKIYSDYRRDPANHAELVSAAFNGHRISIVEVQAA